MQNYYRLLGVSPAASPTDIGRAYQRQRSRLVRLARHDRHMRARLEEVETGYQILSHPGRRLAYDQLRRLEPDEPLPPAVLARQHRRALLLRYAHVARSVNLALLACGLLLALDWALPLRHLGQERVLACTRITHVAASPLPDPQVIYRVSTPHAGFRLLHAQGAGLRPRQVVQVWRTPVLGVVRWVALGEAASEAARFRPYGGTIYTSYGWLPVLLLALAGGGLLPQRRPETYVTLAVAGAVLLLLAVVVVLVL